jgi:hypothetical protein
LVINSFDLSVCGEAEELPDKDTPRPALALRSRNRWMQAEVNEKEIIIEG